MSEGEAKGRFGPGSRRVLRTRNLRGIPVFVIDGGPQRPVEAVLDAWSEAGRWWEGEAEAALFRFQLAGPMVVELARDSDGEWWLVRLYD